MKHVCISHAPLRFTPPVAYEFISPIAIPGVDSEIIPDDILGPGYDGRVLSEYLQLFVLADRWRGSEDFIHLFQYRRYVTPNQPAGLYSMTDGNVRVPDELAPLMVPAAERLSAVDRPTFGSIMKWSVAGQFGRFHPIEDLVNVARAAALCGALTQAEAEEFYNAQLFIPSPTIGIYPAAMLVEHLDLMRQVWDYFRAHFYVPREGYQRRIGGFLMERLQSYLILRHFDRNREAKANVWYRMLLKSAVRMS